MERRLSWMMAGVAVAAVTWWLWRQAQSRSQSTADWNEHPAAGPNAAAEVPGPAVTRH